MGGECSMHREKVNENEGFSRKIWKIRRDSENIIILKLSYRNRTRGY